MTALIDLTGYRFSRLVVLRRAPVVVGQKPKWECACDCGGAIITYGYRLKCRYTKSCGCLRVEAGKSRKTHGFSASTNPLAQSTYAVWANMIDRCISESGQAFKHYGGRGITVCQRWRGSFENFLADMGQRPSAAHSLDRKDVNGNYEPENCRWATSKEQGRNKRNTVYVEFRGERVPLIEAAEKQGILVSTVRERIRNGWTVERALTDRTRISP